MLPDLLQHYTYSVKENDLNITVKLDKGGFTVVDQAALNKLGWIKKSSDTFVLLKPVFEEIPEKKKGLFT